MNEFHGHNMHKSLHIRIKMLHLIEVNRVYIKSVKLLFSLAIHNCRSISLIVPLKKNINRVYLYPSYVTWHHKMVGKYPSYWKAYFDIILFLAILAWNYTKYTKITSSKFTKYVRITIFYAEINLIMFVKIFFVSFIFSCIKAKTQRRAKTKQKRIPKSTRQCFWGKTFLPKA